MECYFGSSKGDYVILCKDGDYRDVYRFGTFGNLIDTCGSIADCNTWYDVDIVSIVGVGTKRCEVLFNESKVVVDEPLMNVLVKVREFGNYLGNIFTIQHEDDLGKFTQVIFAYHKGSFTKRMILGKYSEGEWIGLDG